MEWLIKQITGIPSKKAIYQGTSGQDGGIGRHVSPSHATTKRITTKSKNNSQNFQKIKLYGSLTTKDLKKPQSSRWVGWAEMQRWGREVRRGGAAQRGSGGGGMGKGGPTFMCGGQKLGGIPWQ